MTEQVAEFERQAKLRSRAAARLAGAAARKGAVAKAADALAVLHSLASSPATASDALTLLHEMQVLQVELDLQAHELHESRAELESALRRQIELYHFQPVGCFTLDPQLRLYELNQTGAKMLGVPHDDAEGQQFDAFLSAESAKRFKALLSNLAAGVRHPSCLLKLRSKDSTEWPLLASVGLDPAAKRYFVCLTNAADEAAQPSKAS
jgi:PAS domain-containing protein